MSEEEMVERYYDMALDSWSKAENRIQQLEEALRFYADEENYRPHLYSEAVWWAYPVMIEGGENARAALSSEAPEKEG